MKLVISETVNDIPVVTEKENTILIADFDAGVGSIPLSTVTGKGSLVVGTANAEVQELPVGTNGYLLAADSGETAGTKWIPPSGLASSDVSGWVNPSQTWTYASPTTITVPSGAAAIYSIGDKIKLIQTTQKYFYVVGVADTVLTVTGGTSYAVADAAITSPYYSKAASPLGFPIYMAWNGATGFNAQGYTGAVTEVCYFSIVGRLLNFRVYVSGTSNATSLTGTLPVTAAQAERQPVQTTDNTSTITWGLASVAASTAVTFYTNAGTGAWTNSGTKTVFGQFRYYI